MVNLSDFIAHSPNVKQGQIPEEQRQQLNDALEDLNPTLYGTDTGQAGGGGNNIPTQGLIGYWPLDDFTNDVAADYVGGNDGTVNGNVTVVPGKQDGAASFDGDSYIAIPGFQNLQSSLTISAWIKTRDNIKRGQRIFADDENNSGGYGLSLGDSGTGRLRFYHRSIGGSTVTVDTGNVIANDIWYHVVATVAVTGGSVTPRLFVDADQKATQQVSGALGTDGGPASIGGETDNGETQYRFDGRIDEVRVYDRAIASREVTTLYDATR